MSVPNSKKKLIKDFKNPLNTQIFNVVNKCIEFMGESDLHEYIETNEFFKKYCKWEIVGENIDNFKYLNNQQSDPLRALCEPTINSMDQLLLLECLKRGIDPRDINNPKLPKTMHEAAEHFYGIDYGHLIFTSKNKITNLAQKIKITVFNANNDQDQIILLYDEATGQDPKDFKNTFLYHKPSEKIAIPFVQGKYGMGNGGAFSFSGNHKYVMILSKRNPDLFNRKEEIQNKWGFTLIRKNLSKGYHKSRYFEFLCGKDGQILSFERQEVTNALPELIIDKNGFKHFRLKEAMKFGTLIKYFNYQNRNNKSSRAIIRKLNLYLWDPPLPLSLYVNRKQSTETHMEIFRGGRAKFCRSSLINPKYKEGISFKFSIVYKIDKKNTELNFEGQAFLFNQYRKNKKGKYKNTLDDIRTELGTAKGVLTVNGQTHGILNGTFFQNFTLKSLKKYILVSVDFTKVMRQQFLLEDEFFMPNREEIRNSPVMNKFRKELRKILGSHPVLIKANLDYKKEANERIMTEESIKFDFLKMIRKENPELLEMFNGIPLDKIKINKLEAQKDRNKNIDVVDEISQVELIEKYGYNEKKVSGLKFKKSDQKVISRTVRCDQERIFIHCLSEFPQDEIEIIQTLGKEWKKRPSKTLMKKNLQITLFPSGEEEPGDKIQVIILKLSPKNLPPPKLAKLHKPQKFPKQRLLNEYVMGNYKNMEDSVKMKPSLSELNGDFLDQNVIGSIEMQDKLVVNLIFKEYKKRKIQHKKEKSKTNQIKPRLPEPVPITSKSDYWKDYDLDDDFIAKPNDSEDKIIISIGNKDFVRKFNAISDDKKEKFKNGYIKHIYLTILYHISILKAEKKDIGIYENIDILNMLKASQQAWILSWKG